MREHCPIKPISDAIRSYTILTLGIALAETDLIRDQCNRWPALYKVITWSGILPESAPYKSGKQPITAPSTSLSSISRSSQH